MVPSTFAPESSLLLEARGVGRREPNSDNWLLRHVDIKIAAGSRLAVVGPIGSGKSLLLRALARLDSIDAGEVLWRGAAIHGDAVPDFRRQSVYLHQRSTLIEGTVEDNLRLPFTLGVNRHREYARRTVLSLLEQVNRSDGFLGRSTRDLSGGEARIVCLLRAIQLQPTLLMLDEPTAALDEESTRSIEQLVADWYSTPRSERAFLWVSHDNQQVSRVADRVVAMSAGRLSIGLQ